MGFLLGLFTTVAYPGSGWLAPPAFWALLCGRRCRHAGSAVWTQAPSHRHWVAGSAVWTRASGGRLSCVDAGSVIQASGGRLCCVVAGVGWQALLVPAAVAAEQEDGWSTRFRNTGPAVLQRKGGSATSVHRREEAGSMWTACTSHVSLARAQGHRPLCHSPVGATRVLLLETHCSLSGDSSRNCGLTGSQVQRRASQALGRPVGTEGCSLSGQHQRCSAQPTSSCPGPGPSAPAPAS